MALSPNPELSKKCSMCLAWFHGPSEPVDILNNSSFIPPHHLSPPPENPEALLDPTNSLGALAIGRATNGPLSPSHTCLALTMSLRT